MKRSLAPSQKKGESSLKKPENQQQTSTSLDNNTSSEKVKKFSVVYGKVSTKKHKTYSDDGTLEIEGKKAVLKDANRKYIGSSKLKEPIQEGSKMIIGGWEVQVLESLGDTTNSSTNNPQCQPEAKAHEPPSKKIKHIQETFSEVEPHKNIAQFEDSRKENKIKTFAVVYAKASSKKHKVYTSDGTLEVRGRNALLKDVKGKNIGSSNVKEVIEQGSTHLISGKELQVGDLLSEVQTSQGPSSDDEVPE